MNSKDNYYAPLKTFPIYRGSTEHGYNYNISGKMEGRSGLFSLSIKELEDVEHGIDL